MSLREIHTRPGANEAEELPIPAVDRFKGCILGCAIGDAVGAWAERKPSTVAASYSEALRMFDFSMANAHHGGAPFGQYTDDTQLTRELAISIISSNGLDPNNFAIRLGKAFALDQIVGGGRATKNAARRINEGVAWDKAGEPPPAAGNGAAMRASPIGLFYWNDVEKLIQAARDQAIVSHQAPESVAGAVAIALAVAMCVNASKTTSNPREPGWWAWLARHVSRVDEKFAAEITDLMKPVHASRKLGYAPGSESERRAVRGMLLLTDDPSWDGISPWAKSSVLWSLYCLSAHPTSPWEAICLAIWPGGDVDTTAAMAGAMVGAHMGFEAFPVQAQEIVSKLVDEKSSFWDGKALELLAARLHQAATQPELPTVDDEPKTI